MLPFAAWPRGHPRSKAFAGEDHGAANAVRASRVSFRPEASPLSPGHAMARRAQQSYPNEPWTRPARTSGLDEPVTARRSDGVASRPVRHRVDRDRHRSWLHCGRCLGRTRRSCCSTHADSLAPRVELVDCLGQSRQLLFGGLSHLREVHGVPTLRLIGLAALGQPFGREFADCLQHHEARLTTRRLIAANETLSSTTVPMPSRAPSPAQPAASRRFDRRDREHVRRRLTRRLEALGYTVTVTPRAA